MELRVAFKTDRESAAALKQRIPSASLRGGRCEVVIEGDAPLEVAGKAKKLLQAAHEVDGRSKGFK